MNDQHFRMSWVVRHSGVNMQLSEPGSERYVLLMGQILVSEEDDLML